MGKVLLVRVWDAWDRSEGEQHEVTIVTEEEFLGIDMVRGAAERFPVEGVEWRVEREKLMDGYTITYVFRLPGGRKVKVPVFIGDEVEVEVGAGYIVIREEGASEIGKYSERLAVHRSIGTPIMSVCALSQDSPASSE